MPSRRHGVKQNVTPTENFAHVLNGRSLRERRQISPQTLSESKRVNQTPFSRNHKTISGRTEVNQSTFQTRPVPEVKLGDDP